MINIKIFPKRRNTTTAATQSSSSSSTSGTTTPTNDWFYLNTDTGFVTCRYPFCSVDNIVAMADGNEAASGAGSYSNVNVVDNLTSYETSYALSANQGRVLKSLIDNIPTQGGGGGTATSIDWSNVTNKPSTFTPTAHTHTIADVNGLQNQLTTINNNIATTQSNLSAHVNDSTVHITAAEKNILDNLTMQQIQFITRLMQICTIDANGNITFNGNVHASGNVVAMST